MKSVIALACVLAVASAQFQYTTIRPSAYKPWAVAKNEASRSVFNSPLTATLRPLIASQSSYTAKPIFSSTPFPARSVFSASPSLSVQPELPAQAATIQAATLEASAIPARSVFSASSSLSAQPELVAQPAAIQAASFEASAIPARSVFSASSSASVQPEVSVEATPTPASILEVTATPAPVSWSSTPASWSVTPSAWTVTPTPWSVSATPEAAQVSVVPAVRVAAPPVAPVVQVASVVAQASPVFPSAKIASLPVPRYVNDARYASTLKFNNEINSNGVYGYAFETDNGIVAQAQGSPRVLYNGEEESSPVVSQGAFGWTSPEGREISITYYADENGYHPSGSAIPVAPEIPPQIARALEYIALRQRSAQ